MENNKNSLCKQDLLERGWSVKAIAELLPEPILKTNPQFKKANPMKLWELETVLRMEDTEEFLAFKEAKLKRSIKAKISCEKRAEIFVEEINQCIITIKLIEKDELIKNMITQRDNWMSFKYREEYISIDKDNLDEETMNRWLVNYIRHNLTEYDEHCNKLFNRVGKERGYIALKNNVLTEISKAYPYLAEECKNQSK